MSQPIETDSPLSFTLTLTGGELAIMHDRTAFAEGEQVLVKTRLSSLPVELAPDGSVTQVSASHGSTSWATQGAGVAHTFPGEMAQSVEVEVESGTKKKKFWIKVEPKDSQS